MLSLYVYFSLLVFDGRIWGLTVLLLIIVSSSFFFLFFFFFYFLNQLIFKTESQNVKVSKTAPFTGKQQKKRYTAKNIYFSS